MFPDMFTLQHKSKRLKILKTTSASLSRCAQLVSACIVHPCLHIKVSADGTLLWQNSDSVDLCTQSTASCASVPEQCVDRLCAAGTQAVDEIHFGQGVYCC